VVIHPPPDQKGPFGDLTSDFVSSPQSGVACLHPCRIKSTTTWQLTYGDWLISPGGTVEGAISCRRHAGSGQRSQRPDDRSGAGR
jgi:hypothetical protein